jgi:lipopolysaccharide transport system permease protein
VPFQSSIVPERWRMLYSLNPLVGIIDGFRWSVLGGGQTLYVPGFIVSVLSVIGLIWTGVWYFRRTERSFADVI